MAFTSVFAKASGFIAPSPHRSSTASATNSNTHAEPEQQSESGSMSPTKQRTEKWLREHIPNKKTCGSLDLRKVKGSRVIKRSGRDQRKKRASFWFLPLWFGGSGKSQSQNNDCEEDDLEGDTVIDNDGSVATSEYDNDLTLVVDDHGEGNKGDGTARTLQEHNDRYITYDDPRIQDWTEEERWLFTKLTNRGYEPLLHSTWIMDYPTFPNQLFTNDENRVYINNAHGSIGRACRSLTDLIMAGSRVRDQILSKAATERPLFHAINKYYKWSVADGNVQHKEHIPVIAIASAKGQETVESVVGRVTDQLHSLGRQYRDKWRCANPHKSEEHQKFTHELPTLTGFVIKYSIVAIVTCDSRVPGNPIRTLGTFDFKVVGQDVWHALAVSIAMIRGRNYLMQLDEQGELGPEVVDYGSDPDA
ncbi:MAG: hypothetical protein ASARMPREDX12_001006 [Alectoria sarmentosa]|nr:MAG: hypothetical protein ASARMPRED_000852 [Alectoria sarmentosa]CAD6582686.1 MAG: hypothetical protein ASARMPREDX12_001006 [Alectoria sarmentosa]